MVPLSCPQHVPTFCNALPFDSPVSQPLQSISIEKKKHVLYQGSNKKATKSVAPIEKAIETNNKPQQKY
jgi:hypothetical protein